MTPAMKTNGLLTPLVLLGLTALAAQPAVIEDVVQAGPRAGQKRVIVETVDFSARHCVSTNDTTVTLGPPGRRVTVPVTLRAFQYTFRKVRDGETNPGVYFCYEFQIRSKETNGFIWSCWLPDFPRPHRFQVWTTESGKSYACFVQHGVNLFSLTVSRQPDEMRRAFWEGPTGANPYPDALPVLRIKQIWEAFPDRSGGMFDLDPTAWFVEVLELTERAGELRVTVRGHQPRERDYPGGRVPEGAYEKWQKARATFALRGNHWELVSTTGK